MEQLSWERQGKRKDTTAKYCQVPPTILNCLSQSVCELRKTPDIVLSFMFSSRHFTESFLFSIVFPYNHSLFSVCFPEIRFISSSTNYRTGLWIKMNIQMLPKKTQHGQQTHDADKNTHTLYILMLYLNKIVYVCNKCTHHKLVYMGSMIWSFLQPFCLL